jgi:putative ABC transport system permease protein
MTHSATGGGALWFAIAEAWRRDLRLALRTWRRSPGLAAVAIGTLALAIGANTTVFSLVNAVLLRPLPFPAAERLVQIVEHNAERAAERGWPAPDRPVSAHNYLDYRERSESFESMGWVAPLEDALNVSGAGQPLRAQGISISASLLPLLRIAPALGHPWTEESDRFAFEGPRPVLLSHRFWLRQLGGDGEAIGRTLELDDWPHTVVGVLPAGFELPPLMTRGEVGADSRLRENDLYVPLSYNGFALPRRARQLHVLARLKSDVTLERAQAEISALAQGLATEYPEDNAGWGAQVLSLEQLLARGTARPLAVIAGAVGFLLLIACANIANLMLARAAAREAETAIRAALGASRGQRARELLAETLVLALAGGVIGAGLSLLAVRFLVGRIPQSLPRAAEASLDLRVLSFTLLIALAAGLLAGLLPALRASKVDLAAFLRRRTASGDRGGVSRLLVIVETALALMLLFGAGLLARSFVRLLAQPTGYDAQNVLVAEIHLSRPNYYNSRFYECDPASEEVLLWRRCRRREEEIDRFYLSIAERIRRVPGVESAALISDAPLTDAGIYPLRTLAEDSEVADGDAPQEKLLGRADGRLVYPGYFETMRMRLLAGRDFRADDPGGWTGSAIVNSTLARRFWPGESPLGKKISFYGEQFMTIIGVVEDSLDSDLAARARDDGSLENHVYHLGHFPYVDVMIRTHGDPSPLIEPIRSAILELDATLPAGAVRRMDRMLAASNAVPRFYAQLVGFFAALAVLLAALGLYGVVAYSTSRRTREIGIRMALGADARSVRALVVRHGLAAVAIGLLCGTLGSVAVARSLGALLYGASPVDPLTFATVAIGMLLVSWVACYLPGRRASRLPPMTALRDE